jgi:hypothetical protein
MPWARLDDRFPTHPKVRPLSDAAFRLHVSALCWTAENLTDGRIESRQLRYVSDVKQPTRAAKELVESGLWHVGESGWSINDWHEYNPSREEVLTRRQNETEKKRRQRREKLGLSPGDAYRDTPGESPGESSRALPARADARACGPTHPGPTQPLEQTSFDGPSAVTGRASAKDHHTPEKQLDPQWVSALTAAVRNLRPGWSSPLIKAAIRVASEQAGPDRVARALLVVAADPDSQVPNRVTAPGYWWDDNDTRFKVALERIDNDDGVLFPSLAKLKEGIPA